VPKSVSAGMMEHRQCISAFVSPAGPSLIAVAPLYGPSVCDGKRVRFKLSRRTRWQIPLASIVDEVSTSLTAAMKARDANAARALRLIRAGFLNRMKEDGASTLADADAVAVLRKIAKMRVESIEMFRAGKRDDLVAQEEKDLEIVQRWLPTLADEETTLRWAREAVAESGAKGAAQAGKAIGMLMKHHKGEVDGAIAKRLVTQILSGT
jgi:uncharacterized protein